MNAEGRVQREQRGARTDERCGCRQEFSPSQEAFEDRHLRARKGIDAGIIRAQADTIKEDEEDSHVRMTKAGRRQVLRAAGSR